jgi:hypothetical protein
VTKSEREKLRELEASAMPGPWTVEGECDGCIDGITAGGRWVIQSDAGIYGPDVATAAFIVAARTAIPQLLDENDALRAALLDVCDRVDDCRECMIRYPDAQFAPTASMVAAWRRLLEP